MFCSNCGKEIKDGALFCYHCGKTTAKAIADGVATRRCPYCYKEIEINALKCNYCGKTLSELDLEKLQTRHIEVNYSFRQPVKKLIILGICTYGFYEIYWFYRNWKQLKKHKNLDISPGWRTSALFVPILNIIFIYKQFKQIRELTLDAGCRAYNSAGWLTFGSVISSGISFQLGMRLPPPFTLLDWVPTILGLCILGIAQITLNRYWEAEEDELPLRAHFSGKEILVLVIGTIIVLLIVMGELIPA